jgi:FkbM family methyltransferase
MTNRYAKVSYSQFGEDALVTTILRQSTGFYADIGAHDPWRYSNTALLFERGWHGINVDADPRAIERFQVARPNDINLNVGVAQNAGEMDFALFEDGAVNTFSANLATRQSRTFGPQRMIRIDVRPLSEIFNQHIPAETAIDYLNIDCEGLDEQVVLSNDWSHYRPKVITIELHGLNLENLVQHPVYKFLKGERYVMRGHYYVTSLFQSVESL